MAARRARHHRRRRRDRRAGRRGRSDPVGLSGAGLRRARRALLGPDCARRAVRPDARHRAAARSRAPRSKASCYQTARPDRGDARRLAGRRRAPRPCCASTAAWRRRTGPCSGSPISSDAPVDRPVIKETTALGAAYLAGLAAGLYPEPDGSPTMAARTPLQAQHERGDPDAETERLEPRGDRTLGKRSRRRLSCSTVDHRHARKRPPRRAALNVSEDGRSGAGFLRSPCHPCRPCRRHRRPASPAPAPSAVRRPSLRW